MKNAHGGIDYRALRNAGISPDDVKDFSVSINPVPLPEPVRQIICRSALFRYPDSESRILTEALSRCCGPSPGEIMAVNGTSQAIYLIAAAFLKSGDLSLTAAPVYSSYRCASELYGAQVIEYRAPESSAFRPDCAELGRLIRKKRPRLLWICSPNNPTGSHLNESEVSALARVCADTGCLMILDAAYQCFAPEHLWHRRLYPNTITLHSMTKDFGIPGLRLGWVHADAKTLSVLRRHQPEWSVSTPAQDAGAACLDHMDYFRVSWEETRRLTCELADGLKEIGLYVFPSAANFVLARTDTDVRELSEALWKQLILIRDCASFGLDGYIRIGTRSAEDNAALLEALKRYFG